MISPLRLAVSDFARRKTLEMLEESGLKGWSVVFDYSLERAGQCRYTRKEIAYSLFFLETSDRADQLNTVLHEVAHAIAGPEAGHEEEWANIHRSLGGNGLIQAFQPQRLSTHDYFLWVGTCPKCGYRNGLQEAPQDVYACGACPKTISKFERIFGWSCDGEPIAHLEMNAQYAARYRELVNP